MRQMLMMLSVFFLTISGCDDGDGGGGGGGCSDIGTCVNDCQVGGSDGGHLVDGCICVCDSDTCNVMSGYRSCVWFDAGGTCITEVVEAILGTECGLSVEAGVPCGEFSFQEEDYDTETGCHLVASYHGFAFDWGIESSGMTMDLDCGDIVCSHQFTMLF